MFSIVVLVLLVWLILPTRDFGLALTVGAAIYLLYSFTSRYLIPTAHRAGLAAMAREDYDTAISSFWSSYEFFSDNEWLDRHRSLTMMSPSIWSYREMALMNIASAYIAKEDYVAAETACQRVLKEFPDNEIAKAALNTIQVPPPQREA